MYINDAAVDAHSCADTDTKISLVEQYTTVDKYLIPGHFDLKVFVNCLKVRSAMRDGHL